MGNNSSRGEDDLSLLSSSSIQRTDLDFTDMLWSVLHRVESYRFVFIKFYEMFIIKCVCCWNLPPCLANRELCFALTSVLERIKREELRPFVSKLNFN